MKLTFTTQDEREFDPETLAHVLMEDPANFARFLWQIDAELLRVDMPKMADLIVRPARTQDNPLRVPSPIDRLHDLLCMCRAKAMSGSR